MKLLLTQLLQGTAGFMLLWFLCRRKIAESQSRVTSYEVLARENKRCAVRLPPYFNWPAGLTYSTIFILGLPFLIWRYGIYRTLGLVSVPFAVALGVPKILDALNFTSSSAGNVSLNLFLLLLVRSLIGLGVAWNDSKYYQRTLLKCGWLHVGTYQAKTKKLAIRDSRLSP